MYVLRELGFSVEISIEINTPIPENGPEVSKLGGPESTSMVSLGGTEG